MRVTAQLGVWRKVGVRGYYRTQFISAPHAVYMCSLPEVKPKVAKIRYGRASAHIYENRFRLQ